MPETDLELLVRAATGAGDIATKFAGKTARKWDKPGGAGPVTEADIAVNEYLSETLLAGRPDYGWLSEESDDNADRLTAKTVFIVDPIDGTRSFIEGTRTWAHSIAVATAGIVTAGVVFLPLRDRMYTAASGAGARLNGQTLRASTRTDAQGAEVLCAKPTAGPRYWYGTAPAFTRAYRPSLAYRMALVGEGRFDGMATFRPTWEWDIAAGSLIASEAGAAVSDRSGAPLRFNAPDPRTNGIVAAAPKLHLALLEAHDPDA